MPLDEKKKGSIAVLISKKIKGSDSYENLKSDNENMKEEEYDGLSAAAEEIIDSLNSKDPKSLKESLKSFIEMCLNEKE